MAAKNQPRKGMHLFLVLSLFLAVVKQWEGGDPPQGLVTPLKDWPVEWYTGNMCLVTGTKCSNCKLVAEEYKQKKDLTLVSWIGQDDPTCNAFKAAYPRIYNNLTKLYAAILSKKPRTFPQEQEQVTRRVQA
ncbi:hypothetical protein BDP27DRAFT_1373764 [Rhodocollybia butyracea]|uniref:Uncharacterized protein n=1 Tax=Rhodocollybia butyracea TaxID=206335 RepID=A0A9P5TWZ1_9AGAR|nr:hypothetical protein BDP27DRAFT_1373764 [Rhodocollybia butyracea]